MCAHIVDRLESPRRNSLFRKVTHSNTYLVKLMYPHIIMARLVSPHRNFLFKKVTYSTEVNVCTCAFEVSFDIAIQEFLVHKGNFLSHFRGNF